MKRRFSFSQWLRTKEGFDSYNQYINWLSIMTKEDSRRIREYYKEKYAYWEKYLHTEFD